MITFLMIGVLAVLVFLCVSSSLMSYSGRRLLGSIRRAELWKGAVRCAIRLVGNGVGG